MEKKTVIDFLNKHWDEFATLLSGTAEVTALHICAEYIPDDIYEFANVLSKMISVRQMHTADKRGGLFEKPSL